MSFYLKVINQSIVIYKQQDWYIFFINFKNIYACRIYHTLDPFPTFHYYRSSHTLLHPQDYPSPTFPTLLSTPQECCFSRVHLPAPDRFPILFRITNYAQQNLEFRRCKHKVFFKVCYCMEGLTWVLTMQKQAGDTCFKHEPN